MNDSEYAIMRQVEDSYWWYVTLHESVFARLKASLADRPNARILDAGCGTGGMMEVLRRGNAAWQLTGLDYSTRALDHTQSRGFTDLTQGSVDALPFPAAGFDAVVSLDVLYFDGVDETKAMEEFRRVLKPGGVLVLNLPAFDILRGRHDVAVKGVRRYTCARVRQMLALAGLENLRTHCWNLWLFGPILCWRLLSRVSMSRNGAASAKSDLSMPPARINSMLSRMARLDMVLSGALHSRLGTSVLSVAHKPLPS